LAPGSRRAERTCDHTRPAPTGRLLRARALGPTAGTLLSEPEVRQIGCFRKPQEGWHLHLANLRRS
jgi:hypothetical protein